MKIEPTVIEALQSSVKAHWSAIHFYKLLSGHLKRWGYAKLSERFDSDVSEEIGHLDGLIARIELSDVAPSSEFEALLPDRHDVLAAFNQALSIEVSAADIERAGIETAKSSMDDGTAALLRSNLKGSEDSIKEIEAELKLIEQMGLQNYLANQV